MKDSIGKLEEFVLLSVCRLGDDAYGIKVSGDISDRTGKSYSHGGIYTTLDRLEKKGLLQSSKGEATPARGGRSKRLYTVPEAGIKVIDHIKQINEQMWDGIDENSHLQEKR